MADLTCDHCGMKMSGFGAQTLLKYNDDPRPAQTYCGMCYMLYLTRAVSIVESLSGDPEKKEKLESIDALWKKTGGQTPEPDIK